MKVTDLPDIDFVNVSKEEIEAAIFAKYTEITGRTLSKGDPIRLFVLFIVAFIMLLINKINEVGKQNLLKYAKDKALDNLAAWWGVIRIPAQSAMTTLNVELSTAREQSTIIPAGTRVSPQRDLYFATNEELIIPAGETSATVIASCTDVGIIGNDYAIGEINRIVDPIAYVKSMTNISKSQGGSTIEDDEALRQRTFEAPEALSTAGPELAYKWHAKSTNSAIIDVGVYSPHEGCVTIIPLLKGGEVPGQEVLNAVYDNLSAKKNRPLTDKISVEAPSIVNFSLNVEYYINEDADADTVHQKVNAAVENFILWQKSKLGRDINDSELISYIKAVNGVKRVKVISPNFTVIEDFQLAIADNVNIVMMGSEIE